MSIHKKYGKYVKYACSCTMLWRSLRTRIGFCEGCASMCSMQRKIDEDSPPVFRMQSWKSKLKGGTETEGGCCAGAFKVDNALAWSTCSGLFQTHSEIRRQTDKNMLIDCIRKGKCSQGNKKCRICRIRRICRIYRIYRIYIICKKRKKYAKNT
jgi:hypothetical protein